MFIYLATRARFARSMMFLGVIWALLVSSLMMPASAFAQVSSLSNDVAKPWFESDMKWDSNWGAFNDKQSEKVAGACALNSKQADGLKKLIDALRSDWDHISSDDDLKKKSESTFRSYYNKRLAENKPYDDAADEVKLHNAQGKIKQAAPPSKVEGFDDFYFKINSHPDLAGCDQSDSIWANIVKTLTPNPIEIFKNPGGFFIRVLIYIVCWPVIPIYAIVSPVALGLTLTTPHSERGDTLVNTWNVFSSTSSKSTSSNNVCAYAKSNAGFNCDNLKESKQEDNAWLKVARSLRSALSAFYGVIIVGAALIYMFRKNPGAAYDVKVVLPRVFAAVLLGAAAPYLIGALISTSNFMVQGVLSGGGGGTSAGDLSTQFGAGAGAVPNQVNQAIWSTSQASGGVSGIVGSLFASVLPAILIICFTVGYIMLIFIAIAKQLVLIAAIIATPVACLALVNRKWADVFTYWVRGLVTVVALPVAQALILAIGMALSYAFFDPSGGSKNFVGRLLAAFVLLVTIRMMVKVAAQARGYVTGAQPVAGRARAMGAKLTGMAAGAAATAAGNPVAGAKLYQAGNAVGDRLQERAQRGGGFIPRTSGGGMLSAAASRGPQAPATGRLLDRGMDKITKPGATVSMPGIKGPLGVSKGEDGSSRIRPQLPGIGGRSIKTGELAQGASLAQDAKKLVKDQKIRKAGLDRAEQLTDMLRAQGKIQEGEKVRLNPSGGYTVVPDAAPPGGSGVGGGGSNPKPSVAPVASGAAGAAAGAAAAGAGAAAAGAGRKRAAAPSSNGGLAPTQGAGPSRPAAPTSSSQRTAPTPKGPMRHSGSAPQPQVKPGEQVSPGGVIIPGGGSSRVGTTGDRTRGGGKDTPNKPDTPPRPTTPTR